MAVSREQLIFDIFANTSRASGDIKNFARTTAAASDDVMGLAKRLDELSRKSATARVGLKGDADAQFKLDKLDFKTEQLAHRVIDVPVSIEGAARAAFEIQGLDAELDHLKDKSAEATGERGLASLIGSGGISGGGLLGVAVAAGVVLSPVIATLGFGLGGLALAAVGASKNSKALAQELAPLKQDVAAFQKELQPVVLQDFGKAAGVARDVLHGIEPVANAAGKALGEALGQIDAEFKSQTWQNFFAFMARTAGPDIQLLTKNFTDLLQILPSLLQALQPIAHTLLTDTDAIVKFVAKAEDAYKGANQLATVHKGTAHQTNILADAFHNAVQFMAPEAQWAGKLTDKLSSLGSKTGTAAQNQAVAAANIKHGGDAAIIAASKVQSLADAVQHLNTQLNNSIKPNATFNTDLINVRDSAKQAADALDKTHDKIGLNTAAQRNAFQYQQTYINNLVQLTQDAGHNRDKQDEATAAIRRALPQLEHVKGGTREYWQEVRTLIAWLEKERRERNIHKVVSISGAATWSLSNPGGKLSGPTGSARGEFLHGYGGGDRHLRLLESGEAVVSKETTAAHYGELRSWGVPGMSAGGIVPSYSGNVAGLVPWGQHNVNATNTWLINTMASALARSFTAIGMPGGHGAIGGGVRQWAPLVLRVLALLGQPAGDLGTVLSQMTTESGGNQFAINLWDSNAAAGHPSQGLMQVIPSTFAAYAGPFFSRGILDPLANIFAGLNYAIHRYGAAWTEVLGHGHGYDNGGYLPPGLSLAYNGTGKPERVGGGNVYNINITLPAGSDREQGRRIVEYIRKFEQGSGTGWRR